MGVVGLELRVQVDPAIDGVHEAVQALARAGVGAVGFHLQDIALPQSGEPYPVPVEHVVRVQRLAVERDGVHPR